MERYGIGAHLGWVHPGADPSTDLQGSCHVQGTTVMAHLITTAHSHTFYNWGCEIPAVERGGRRG